MRMRGTIFFGASVAAALVLISTQGMAQRDLKLDAAIGFHMFSRNWTPGISSAAANDGLGPLFNARSCVACHQDLRRSTMPDVAAMVPISAVIRLSRHGALSSDFGMQLQTMGVPGVAPEAAPVLIPDLTNGLRNWRLSPNAGPSVATTELSLRIAPDLSMMGAIAAIDPVAIAAGADPDDRNGDGISGRVNRAADGRIGRFGHKAKHPDLASQIEAAFATDLGLSTLSHPDAAGDCVMTQTACRAAPGAKAAKPEIDPKIVATLVAYLEEQQGAKKRQISSDEGKTRDSAGELLFQSTGCTACHAPTLPDRNGKPVRLFSDLLLHDLGPGLADAVTEAAATGAEWRTAPLSRLDSDTMPGFLHDGRARSLDEAVLWHGGEATAATNRFKALPPDDHDTLIRYLKAQ